MTPEERAMVQIHDVLDCWGHSPPDQHRIIGNIIREAIRETHEDAANLRARVAELEGWVSERAEEHRYYEDLLAETDVNLRTRVAELEELLQRAVDGDSEGSWMQEVRATLCCCNSLIEQSHPNCPVHGRKEYNPEGQPRAPEVERKL